MAVKAGITAVMEITLAADIIAGGHYGGNYGGHYGGHYRPNYYHGGQYYNYGYGSGYGAHYSHYDPYYYGGYYSDCFIATAAYGTPLSGSVQTLRSFRDTHMRGTAFGDWFIRQYEANSPPVAAFIAHNPILRIIVATLLAPLVFAAGMWMKSPLLFLLTLGLMFMVLRNLKRRWRYIFANFVATA